MKLKKFNITLIVKSKKIVLIIINQRAQKINYLRMTKYILITCILTILTIKYSNGLRILGLFPLHGKSHFTMCESLMKGLAEKGHKVDVYSHFPQKKSLPNYTDININGKSLSPLVNSMTYENLTQASNGNIKRMVGEFGTNLCYLMNNSEFQRLFESLKKNQPYDVVVVEVV